jgi:hypothetical protein
MTHSPLYFPPGVVDVDGRRIRPGVIVSVDHRAGRHEVVGWRTDGLVLVDTETGDLSSAPKESCRILDDEITPRSTTGAYVVEFSDRRTTLVMAVGTRDIAVDGESLDQSNVRDQSRELVEQLVTEPRTQALVWSQEHLSAPILDRVLVEASLPVDIDELVLVVTDQTIPHPRDTRFVGELLRWHLRARGHVGDEMPLADDVRPIATTSFVTLTSLPHVIEAVHFAISPFVPTWFEGDGRVAVVTAGGTPAMSFGVLLAAASYARHAELPSNSVRTIQVPDVRGDGTRQPVIEFDVDDLTWWADTR